jgi:hypothetical protein
VWPPVFDPWSLEDIRGLDSFVVTVNEKNTVNGQLTARTLTTGYIRDPLSAYFENEYSGGVDRTYVVNDRTYALTGSGDWYISAGASDDVFYAVDIPAHNTERLVEAKFAGAEAYQGIPAYHFVLEAPDSAESNGNELVGDLLLAVDGNYVLYSHWTETSRQGDFSQVFEVTEAMSSIGQLTEIELPTDMKNMPSTSDVPLDLKLPLPPDSAFRGMIRYRGFGVDDYYFSPPRTSIDEFLDSTEPAADGRLDGFACRSRSPPRERLRILARVRDHQQRKHPGRPLLRRGRDPGGVRLAPPVFSARLGTSRFKDVAMA